MGKLLSKHRHTIRHTTGNGLPSSEEIGSHSSPERSPEPVAPTVTPVFPTNNNNASLVPIKIVKALYDYIPQQSDDLGFSKGDKLKIVDEETSSDWWLARHLTTQAEGYIPSNYVVEDNDSPEAQDWWFSIDRREANKQLMLPGNSAGTFLIRNAADHRSYALSVRVFDEKTKNYVSKHYRIKKLADGSVGVSEKKKFSSLVALVTYYSENADGLCCRLVTPCPKEVQLVPFKKLEVPRSSIELANKLGAGQFGEVWAARCTWYTSNVAVKTLKPGSMSAEAFLEEAKTMHQLRHRKLVQLLGVCTTSEPMYIITELMSNGSLLDYLRSDEGRTISIAIVIDMAAQIADGMAYLEGKNFIHRDLRAANILVGDNNNVKVADFGLARILDSDIYDAGKDTKFPIKWTAPEAAFEHRFSVKSDVWSYGVLLYEIVTYGRTPYPGMDGSTTLDRVQSGYRMPRPTGRVFDCPPKMYEIMLKCWDSKAANRPTFAYLLNFFDDYATESEEHYHPPENEH